MKTSYVVLGTQSKPITVLRTSKKLLAEKVSSHKNRALITVKHYVSH